jgi:hypothetical protein
MGKEGRRLAASVQRRRAGGRRQGGISQGTTHGSRPRGKGQLELESRMGKKVVKTFILSICGAHRDCFLLF